MSGHLFRSQTSAFFHAVCGRMDSGTFSKSAGAVSGTAREAGAAPRLDADHYCGAGDCDGLFYGAGLLVYREMGSFLADAPEIYQSVIAEIENALQNGRKLAEYFPQNLQPPLLAFSDNLDGLFGKLVSRAAEPTVQIAGHVAKSIPNLLVNMVIIILSSYLFLRTGSPSCGG